MKKSGLNTIIAGHFTKGHYDIVQLIFTTLMIIEPGQTYLLDGKTEVKVIKPINRSHTMYSIEIPGHSIESVEKTRLVPVQTAAPSAEKR